MKGYKQRLFKLKMEADEKKVKEKADREKLAEEIHNELTKLFNNSESFTIEVPESIQKHLYRQDDNCCSKVYECVSELFKEEGVYFYARERGTASVALIPDEYMGDH
ncbi:MAG: hypothetical protein ACRC5M_05025 [Anaeroplasmataceae bacterium]